MRRLFLQRGVPPAQESCSEPGWLGLAGTGRFMNEPGLAVSIAEASSTFRPGTPEIAPTWRPLRGPADVSCVSLWRRPV